MTKNDVGNTSTRSSSHDDNKVPHSTITNLKESGGYHISVVHDSRIGLNERSTTPMLTEVPRTNSMEPVDSKEPQRQIESPTPIAACHPELERKDLKSFTINSLFRTSYPDERFMTEKLHRKKPGLWQTATDADLEAQKTRILGNSSPAPESRCSTFKICSSAGVWISQ